MITIILAIIGIIFAVSILSVLENLFFDTEFIGCLVTLGGIVAFVYFAFVIFGA